MRIYIIPPSLTNRLCDKTSRFQQNGNCMIGGRGGGEGGGSYKIGGELAIARSPSQRRGAQQRDPTRTYTDRALTLLARRGLNG